MYDNVDNLAVVIKFSVKNFKHSQEGLNICNRRGKKENYICNE